MPPQALFTFASQIQSYHHQCLTSRMSHRPKTTNSWGYPAFKNTHRGCEQVMKHTCAALIIQANHHKTAQSSKLHQPDRQTGQRQQLELELTDWWLISDRCVIVQFNNLGLRNGWKEAINTFFIKKNNNLRELSLAENEKIHHLPKSSKDFFVYTTCC